MAFWIAKDTKFLHADNENSNQTASMHRLIWVFVRRTYPKGRFSHVAAQVTILVWLKTHTSYEIWATLDRHITSKQYVRDLHCSLLSRIPFDCIAEHCWPITKTCLYKFDPFKPHFYIVKVGFTVVHIIFLMSAQKHRLWVLVRTALSRRF